MAEKKGKTVIVDGVHNYSAAEAYIQPDPHIREQLEDFKDLKLAFMVHWGLYNQLGILPSWGMVDAEAKWSRKLNDYADHPYWAKDGAAFREDYFDLIHSFNPICFDADEWAEIASDCGFKYLIFTTKHHDGFCMWDTKQTDYKVTSPECPYSKRENADIVKQVFAAFRKKGMKIGAYFSKPDWHSQDYWEKEVWEKTPTTRMTTYDVKEKPEKWQAFTEYTHNQMMELVRDCGKVDILWLDGGQVTVRDGLDIKMEEIVPKLREINPDLIVADRTAGTEFENYITPELLIPEEAIDVPWESCLTLGQGFHYVYDDDYKSVSELLSLLLEIVCKGGNLALNVSPQPNGRIPRNAVKVLRELGAWLKKYGEAIYCTRPCAPYKVQDTFLTQTKECIYLVAKGSLDYAIPCEQKIVKAEFLNENRPVAFTQVDGKIMLTDKVETDEEYAVIKLYKQCR